MGVQKFLSLKSGAFGAAFFFSLTPRQGRLRALQLDTSRPGADTGAMAPEGLWGKFLDFGENLGILGKIWGNWGKCP